MRAPGSAIQDSARHRTIRLAKLKSCDFSSNSVSTEQGSRAGALAAKNCRFELSGSSFRANHGGTGSALYYTGIPATPLSTIEDTRFFSNIPDPTVQADALIDWICFPGQYMLQVGPATGNFDGCYPCSAGSKFDGHGAGKEGRLGDYREVLDDANFTRQRLLWQDDNAPGIGRWATCWKDPTFESCANTSEVNPFKRCVAREAKYAEYENNALHVNPATRKAVRLDIYGARAAY